jgi:voltage-gated potassium channel
VASSTLRVRRRVYEILHNPRSGDGCGRAIGLGLLLLIAANVTANIVETDAKIAAAAPEFFRIFELVSVVIFTIEYLLRLWSSVEDPRFAGRAGRLRMLLSPMALIDLAAIAPFYVTLVAPSSIDMRYLRVLRLLRIFRLLRSRRVAESFGMLTRVVQAKRVEIGVTVAVVGAAMLLSAGAMYMVERGQPDTQFTSIPRTMWWAIVTITTIGYGDMVPQTAMGQIVGGFVGFLGICALALPVGIVSSGFIEEINRKTSDAPADAPIAAPTAAASPCPHCGRS